MIFYFSLLELSVHLYRESIEGNGGELGIIHLLSRGGGPSNCGFLVLFNIVLAWGHSPYGPMSFSRGLVSNIHLFDILPLALFWSMIRLYIVSLINMVVHLLEGFELGVNSDWIWPWFFPYIYHFCLYAILLEDSHLLVCCIFIISDHPNLIDYFNARSCKYTSLMCAWFFVRYRGWTMLSSKSHLYVYTRLFTLMSWSVYSVWFWFWTLSLMVACGRDV